jgi:glycosyltransferase involved in cell wall biosynthesis
MNGKRKPFVSICTPTFNRRPFIPHIIKCIEHQLYPKDKIEWIIIDDGTDKIEDLVKNIPYVKYFKYDTKLTLGKKRNISHEKSIGDIIVYMDDDDYYPPERISHAVEKLQQNSNVLCAGSSEMYIYFKHIHKMYKFGPYATNHATAATFAFKKELLLQTTYDELSCVAEEKHFLKNYTIPMVQLDSIKTILVFSHIHNSFDKKVLLAGAPNKMVTESHKTPRDFIKNNNDIDIFKYFMEDIDSVLDAYDPGNPSHKPDVLNQMALLQTKREALVNQQTHQQHIKMIQDLMTENTTLKEKVAYLEAKITQIISKQIQERKHVIQNQSNLLLKELT